MRGSATCILAALIAFGATPATAEIVASGEDGFVSHNEAIVAVSPQTAFEAMLNPADWWSSEHTYSGNASNMVMRGTVGGCFCEVIPDAGDNPDGEIEHMRVIYMAPYSTLRLTGALGPLQSEAAIGVLTVTFEPAVEGTRITWDYVVGGYMRMPMDQMAPLVDQAIGEQLARLAARLAES